MPRSSTTGRTLRRSFTITRAASAIRVFWLTIVAGPVTSSAAVRWAADSGTDRPLPISARRAPDLDWGSRPARTSALLTTPFTRPSPTSSQTAGKQSIDALRRIDPGDDEGQRRDELYEASAMDLTVYSKAA